VADGKASVKTQSLYKRFTDIQFGRMAVPYGWMQLVRMSYLKDRLPETKGDCMS
jgi:hypothetical protein